MSPKISDRQQNPFVKFCELNKRDVMSFFLRQPPKPQLSKQIIFSNCYRRLCSSKCRLPYLLSLNSSPSFSSRNCRRYAATTIRKSIEELPQGLQAPLEPFIEKEASKYSPVIDEVLQNQRRFPKCVLLTRVGQFYEVTPWVRKVADGSCTFRKLRRLRRCLI